jgi:hypothetical protein
VKRGQGRRSGAKSGVVTGEEAIIAFAHALNYLPARHNPDNPERRCHRYWWKS